MIRLVEIDDTNWSDVARLSVADDQKRYLDSPLGIVARGYAYRAHRAKVIGIADEETLVGVALVKDLDEEPACYDLQQFLIDHRYQNKGYGTQALTAILHALQIERKYDCVEVCVDREDLSALHVYQKVGFVDTGYIDPDLPDHFNLMYYFE